MKIKETNKKLVLYKTLILKQEDFVKGGQDIHIQNLIEKEDRKLVLKSDLVIVKMTDTSCIVLKQRF